jgi:hypothetical protein
MLSTNEVCLEHFECFDLISIKINMERINQQTYNWFIFFSVVFQYQKSREAQYEHQNQFKPKNSTIKTSY